MLRKESIIFQHLVYAETSSNPSVEARWAMIHNKDLTDGCAVLLSCKAEQVLCFLLHPVTLYVPGGLVYVRSAGNKCSADELLVFFSLLLSWFSNFKHGHLPEHVFFAIVCRYTCNLYLPEHYETGRIFSIFLCLGVRKTLKFQAWFCRLEYKWLKLFS